MKNITRHRLRITAALLGADFIVFSFINPRTAPAIWLIVGYALLGLTVFGLASIGARALKGYGDGAYQAARRFLRYGAVLAVALVGLQSIGQLTVRDLAALIPLLVIAYWYFGYGKRSATE